MKKLYTTLTGLALIISMAASQTNSPCSHDKIVSRMAEHHPNVLLEIEENEVFIQSFIQQMKTEEWQKNNQNSTYIIPVVLHVFHYGDDGYLDMDQIQSGMDILNDDFNGFNEGWNTIDPAFDSIKGILDIQFCLASIDPQGNPTTGVNYYEDEAALYNNGDLFQYAWDNYKYLNIYLPKYVFGEPSDFTAYAYYPSTTGSDNNRGGIFYSSIRWGYGNHSELSPGQDWASVITHEAGHWLNLRHTFESGCAGFGDFVADTPPTQGSGIELSGCNNNDFSCGVHTNGENFMDYNHDCKKMFTQGQVERMITALHFPSRLPLWSESNLMATGCAADVTNTQGFHNEHLVKVFPNPAIDRITFEFESLPEFLSVYDGQGRLILEESIKERRYSLNTNPFAKGMFFYVARFEDKILNGKFFKE